jgi:hypothetical protein
VAAEPWNVEISSEVQRWYSSLKNPDLAAADRAFDRLRKFGPDLRMPHSRSLHGGLHELRFDCEGVARRITYYFDEPRRAITLTTFRKQRQVEAPQVERARKAMQARKAQAPRPGRER